MNEKEDLKVRISRRSYLGLKRLAFRLGRRQLGVTLDELIAAGLQATDDGRAALKAAEVDL